MNEDDMRGRFRRDYSRPVDRAPIRSTQQAPEPTAPPEPKQRKEIRLALPALPSLSRRTAIILAGVVVIGVLAAGTILLLGNGRSNKPGSSASVSISGATSVPAAKDNEVKISVYTPKNLPSGYTYNNDGKVLKANVYYFSVTGPGNQLFYVTQQPIPPNFDFVSFNKKFLDLQTFTSDAGTGTSGIAGTSLIGSIQTNKNTWILINSASASSQTELQTIARSLEPR